MGGRQSGAVYRYGDKPRKRGRLFRVPGPIRQAGFTVIEVMIVLAVTGFLFVGAAVLIAGRQARTEFDQAIRQVQSQIQQVINEVAIGYYPNSNNFQCTVTGNGAPSITAGTAEQGTNSDCIFMGKVIQFKVANTDPEQFKVYTLVGRRSSAASPGTEVTSLSAAMPVVVAPTASNSFIPDNSENLPLNGGLTTDSMVWGEAGVPTGAVAFSQSLAQYSGGLIQSGAQRVSVIPITNSQYAMTLDMVPTAAAESINRNFPVSTVDPASGVRICFASGGTNQSGLIQIGGVQGQLSVTLTIKSNKTCS